MKAQSFTETNDRQWFKALVFASIFPTENIDIYQMIFLNCTKMNLSISRKNLVGFVLWEKDMSKFQSF